MKIEFENEEEVISFYNEFHIIKSDYECLKLCRKKGYIKQSDLGSSNGLKDFLERYDDTKERIKLTTFTRDDVERHPVVKDILSLYDAD